ncbi:MAG: hypothetical protein AAGI15_07815 [Pseudomonadota bacterium]
MSLGTQPETLQPRHRAALGLGFALLLGGCALAPDQPAARLLSQARLADALILERSDRWRFSASSAVHVRSANEAPLPGWEAAALAGLQYAFPRAQATAAHPDGIPAAPPAEGLEIYVRWPALETHRSIPARPWSPALPRKLARLFDAHSDASIGVVIVDVASGRVVEHSELRLRQHGAATDAQWPRLLTEAFSRYAQALRSG